jgi:cellulose synthase/poly-beta-1,6-N-acetylglucosamine synthase-like glycosyltransferase
VLVFWLLAARLWYRQRTVPLPLVPQVDSSTLLETPLVSIIVPARNEERQIAACVQSLLAQDYTRCEVIVVNDRSEDDTGAILDRLAATEPRLKVVHGKPLPEGWMVGRTYPLYQGYQVAQGDWLLITDADTIHAPGLLTGVMAMLLDSPASYATILGFVREPTVGAYVMNLAVCMCIYMLTNPKSYYDPKSRISQLNGQYMLFAREAYEAIGTHEAVRHYAMDDTAMGYLAKLHGYVPLVIDGRDLLQTTMYYTLVESWRGWSRLMVNSMWITQGPVFGSIALLGRTLAMWLLWMTPWIVGGLGVLRGDHSLLLVGSLQLLACLAAIRVARGRWLAAVRDMLTMPVSVLLLTAVVGWTLIRAWRSGGTVWKGRVTRADHRLPPWNPQELRCLCRVHRGIS